jgi:NAD(P)-dependent dehydrogenase (short-subunit alcohol dehydrogenase family)
MAGSNDAQRWTTESIPDLSGRTLVITGSNSGLGFETTRAAVSRGARVVLACRDATKTDAAIGKIRAEHPGAEVEFAALDLASLSSIRDCAKALSDRLERIDVLCNNAGVMAIPYRKTADGFEMQIGTNHLGHFALTGLLLDKLLAGGSPRVVNVSSGAHKAGRMRFDDLHWERGYRKWPAYAQSKLANLLFTYALQRRFEGAGVDAISLAAHPGYAATNLQFVGPQMTQSSIGERVMAFGNSLFAQDAASGALPTLRAATAPDVAGGEYWGPDGPFEMWGYPKRVESTSRSHDRADAERLWQTSVDQTGVDYATLDGSR